MKTCLVALALLGTACTIINPRERPTIRYDRVRVHWSHTVFGYEPSVELDITTLTHQPHVGPHVLVEMICDGRAASVQAFFMTLSRARPADTFHETATLHHAHRHIPATCDLVLSFPGGRPGPVRYCVRGTALTPGECR
jgi:hypothetical protein